MERNANKYSVMLCVDCGIMRRKLASEEHGRGQNMVGFLFYGLLHLDFAVNELKKKARRALLVEFLLVPTAYFRSKMTHHSTRGPWFRAVF